MEVTAKQVAKAVLNYGLEARSYSGRGMYGAQCLGVDIGSWGEVMHITCALVAANVDVEDIKELGERMLYDNMGRGMIVYWPALKIEPQSTLRTLLDDWADGPDEDGKEG